MNVFQFISQNRTEVLDLTTEHLWLVGASITLAVLIGIPLGILITRWPVFSKPVLGSANIIQTVPSPGRPNRHPRADAVCTPAAHS